jgi:hypothetical protein
MEKNPFCNLCVPSLYLSKVFHFLRWFLEPATHLDFSSSSSSVGQFHLLCLPGFAPVQGPCQSLFFYPVERSASVNLGFSATRSDSRVLHPDSVLRDLISRSARGSCSVCWESTRFVQVPICHHLALGFACDVR